jgi:hypothetical protein
MLKAISTRCSTPAWGQGFVLPEFVDDVTLPQQLQVACDHDLQQWRQQQ